MANRWKNVATPSRAFRLPDGLQIELVFFFKGERK